MLENIFKKPETHYMDVNYDRLKDAQERFKSFRDLFKHRICPNGFNEKPEEFSIKTDKVFLSCRLDYDRILCLVIASKDISMELSDLRAIHVDCLTNVEIVSLESPGGVIRIAYEA